MTAPPNPLALPGTPLLLPRLPGFVLATGFTGVVRPECAASVLAQVLPAPWVEIAPALTPERLRREGLVIGYDEATTVKGQQARLLYGTQEADGAGFEKWILLVDGATRCFLLTATYPARFAAELAKPVRQALLGLSWTEHDAPDAPLGFALGDTDALVFATVWSQMAIYTPDGTFVPGRPGEALFLAGWGARALESEEARRAYFLERLAGIDRDLLGQTVTTLRPVDVDGLEGLEGQAVGTSRSSGERRALYQMMLYTPTRYAILVGVADEAAALRYVPAFQALAQGFRRQG